MATHMNENDRKRIEFLLNLNWTVSDIAKDRGRSESTILREILNRRTSSRRNYGCSNRICAHYNTCTRIKGYGPDPKRSFRYSQKCYLTCPEFREAACEKLAKAPYVCNGCTKMYNCPLIKRLYIADSAQANYTGTLRESRSGIRPDDEKISAMNKVLSPCLLRKQSVRHIISANPKLFEGVSERAIYEYIESGFFDIRACDLPYAGRRRTAKKKAVTKTNAKCRVGRTYEEFIAYRKTNPELAVVEMDTVLGQMGGKLLFTFNFNDCGLILGFLRDAKTSQTCTRVINLIWDAAGPELFRELFAIILTDNGTEFSDPDGIELYRPDPIHNSTKLLPRGIKLFYCDAYCSSQKPHVERSHRELRRVLEHGTSFNTLCQDDINLVMSNVNCYTRDWLGGKSPYDRFVELHGEVGRSFLEKLGIVRIPANEVTLDPLLLGAKFKRHADKVIKEKYDVRKSDLTIKQK